MTTSGRATPPLTELTSTVGQVTRHFGMEPRYLVDVIESGDQSRDLSCLIVSKRGGSCSPDMTGSPTQAAGPDRRVAEPADAGKDRRT